MVFFNTSPFPFLFQNSAHRALQLDAAPNHHSTMFRHVAWYNKRTRTPNTCIRTYIINHTFFNSRAPPQKKKTSIFYKKNQAKFGSEEEKFEDASSFLILAQSLFAAAGAGLVLLVTQSGSVPQRLTAGKPWVKYSHSDDSSHSKVIMYVGNRSSWLVSICTRSLRWTFALFV